MNKRKAEMESKSGRAYSVRCDPEFLIDALLLKLKSSKVYRLFKKEGILPLPSVETVRNLISSSDAKFGFNGLALDAIKRELANLPP